MAKTERARAVVAEPEQEQSARTLALRVIAALLLIGAAHLLSAILLPFVIALFVAVALSPAADWLERRGLNRTATSLLGLLLVALLAVATLGLVAYQAASVLGNSQGYTERLGDLAGRADAALGAQGLMGDLGLSTEPGRPIAWGELVRDNAQGLGRWALTGVGGLIGFVGGLVLILAFLFYMLLTRSEWIDRISRAARALGLWPGARRLAEVRDQVQIYISRLALVSACYAVVITLVCWAIGLPNPILWGVLTGLLEVVPYFGPLIAGALPTVVALGTGDSWWQPVAVAALFVVLQTFEGYVVAPVLYGKAVEIDPVTVLLGVLFFGWLWGPAGLAVAMPMLILLRGLLAMTPDTPALDALMEADEP